MGLQRRRLRWRLHPHRRHMQTDMKFVDQLTESRKKVTVLHEGSVLAEGLLADVQANEKVVKVYLGH